MKIHFYLRYHTRFGENLFVHIDFPDTAGIRTAAYPLEYLNDDFWHGVVECASEIPIRYRYELRAQQSRNTLEWEQHRTLAGLLPKTGDLQVIDHWNPAGAVENAFDTQPFTQTFLRRSNAISAKKTGKFTHTFRVKAPLLQPDETLCLLGHGKALRNWDSAAPLLLQTEDHWWTLRVDLSDEDFPLAYKYGVWDERNHQLKGFEEGANRTLFRPLQNAVVGLHDGFARFPNNNWRGAGVAIPVFSLRSEKSGGIGEFTDLPLLADWAKQTGLKLIQLLPVNDTSANGAWTDSYPYAAISAFALHPAYVNLAQIAGKKHAALLKPFEKHRKQLNALDAVDYEGVMKMKWELIRQLYAVQKAEFLNDPAFLEYFEANKHWLQPYAAFIYLKEKYGTTEFHHWPKHQAYVPAEIEKLSDPKSKTFDEVALHYFVQWHLHLQLKSAVEYLHSKGIALKGDIPIGIYRYSCDAWMAPELYNMDMQAGAPPDDFAVNGQNWGFPTYNWDKMQADGFAWWRQRFAQMSLYFDAFRIDHILGFFRIWSIPIDATEGILGRFVPAIPVTERELQEAGIGFNYQRLCEPFINERVLWETFGDNAEKAASTYLNAGAESYRFKPAFDTQRKLEAHFAQLPTTEENQSLLEGLKRLHANVILLPTGSTENEGGAFAFRIGMENTSSFRQLDPAIQGKLQALYLDFFFRRQDDFWQEEAMEKLPALKRATNMLICGEDLGMVPHCVPDVMRELGILSLEIQRMPKQSGATFFHPKDAPYLSVVTPSTHDMSTLRGWWEEDAQLTQRFFNEVLGHWGKAPFYCEPWINRALVEQHLQSPAMWSIFQLQDLLGIDGAIRRENPHDERINIPANPKHYWRYRMHLSLENLQQQDGFNAELRKMVEGSGR